MHLEQPALLDELKGGVVYVEPLVEYYLGEQLILFPLVEKLRLVGLRRPLWRPRLTILVRQPAFRAKLFMLAAVSALGPYFYRPRAAVAAAGHSVSELSIPK